MLLYKNLIIIGTSHISKDSIDKVKSVIEEAKPAIVAIELDKGRLHALLSNEKRKISFNDVMDIGVKGLLFNIIGAWVEKKLGEYVGVKPGSEMKQAVISANKANAKIALIDQDVRITLRRLSFNITWKEKFRFAKDIIAGLVFRKQIIEPFDIAKVPSKEIIKKLIGKLKLDYPNVYKVLIKERNEVIAKNLYNLIKINKEDKIVAIIGAGHEEDVIRLIKKRGN